MSLADIQKDHFDKMTPDERARALHETHRQLDTIAMSGTRAAQEKTAELQARIDYLRELGKE